MCTTKDVTVSKLSQLQKRVLVYARQQMLAKQQKIEPREGVTACFPAPSWLHDALTKTLRRIFHVRKIGAGQLGDADRLDNHEWVWFFEEMRFAEAAIKQAAKEAGKDRGAVRMTELYRHALPPIIELRLAHTASISIYPWPFYSDHDGWYFVVGIRTFGNEPADKAKITACFEQDGVSGFWINDGPSIPINCTIPEMLRDLFDFPLRKNGRIYALAFDVQAIGKARYNNAQASLRRACDRLYKRELVTPQRGQSHGLHWALFERTGIGLTEAGVAAADALIAMPEREGLPPRKVRVKSMAKAEEMNAT